MTDCFGNSTGYLQWWEWDCYGVNSWSESHIPRDTGRSILTDGISVHGNLLSLGSLSLAPIAKAHDGACHGASAGFSSLGTLRSSMVRQRLCLPSALHTPGLHPNCHVAPTAPVCPMFVVGSIWCHLALSL